MRVVKAPGSWLDQAAFPYIFLGGSIEMGKAEDWQTRITKAVDDLDGTILNPRRDDWDASWIQDPTPGTQFYEQVSWELLGQEISDLLVYYFVPGTQSPITLLEFGLFANEFDTEKFVYCTPDFWRYGNVKMVCDRYGITCYEDEAEFIAAIREAIRTLNEL
jgi:hypothetical protein